MADLVAQTLQHQRAAVATTTTTTTTATPTNNNVDWRRTVAFMTYGGLYQGVAQTLLFNNLYSHWFGDATHWQVVAQKVLFNAIFNDALLCIPMAYAIKAFVFRFSLQTALQQYWSDVWQQHLLLKNYALFIPVNIALFTVVPPHFRTTVLAMVSFFWMIILSSVSSRQRGEAK
mmetsp:Transcript_18554/g.50713  ORF Transcript_18554/g.50713 Transcript_18554/m.50713 type:complete len:174 (-) Transcript_18554:133-654(-)